MTLMVALPETKVALVSAEGFEFIIDVDAAKMSTTLRAMLDSGGRFQETETRRINLKEISTSVLEKIPPEMALETLMAANFLDA